SEREFWAVEGVSFKVAKGEVVGIIGPNGAGKSTILKMLSGILKPNMGTMHVKGRLSALIEVTAGFHPELTGRENVYLNGTILGMKKKELDDKFEQIVEFSGIREFIDTPIKRYSSGMLSRLGFSVAAHVDPEVLLVDEVLAVGDIAFQSKCAAKMRELLNSGTTIAIVSHNMTLIHSLCKRVILINKGKVLKDGNPDEVIPYYENIVFKQQEDEFKQRLNRQTHKVKVNDQSQVNIANIKLFNDKNEQKDSFSVSEALNISFDYELNEPIPKPVFSVELMRADGVLCCVSYSEHDGGLEILEKGGSVTIHLGRLNIAPGIYAPKITVWDKDLIHPYIINKQKVFNVEVSSQYKHTNAVFIADIKWEINK
ncbi:MAG: ABC transporter ATP-binding protein, partial [Candidatus Omnitrophica bacterium]|nr:ABC transporter ATP-binding protein [Candidatus Omnitrophota bacterium]